MEEVEGCASRTSTNTFSLIFFKHIIDLHSSNQLVECWIGDDLIQQPFNSHSKPHSQSSVYMYPQTHTYKAVYSRTLGVARALGWTTVPFRERAKNDRRVLFRVSKVLDTFFRFKRNLIIQVFRMAAEAETKNRFCPWASPTTQ